VRYRDRIIAPDGRGAQAPAKLWPDETLIRSLARDRGGQLGYDASRFVGEQRRSGVTAALESCAQK